VRFARQRLNIFAVAMMWDADRARTDCMSMHDVVAFVFDNQYHEPTSTNDPLAIRWCVLKRPSRCASTIHRQPSSVTALQ
jgi:hypothetical protein